MNYAYTVIEIELPEWETGSVIEHETYNNPVSAFDLMDELKINDEDGYYEVIIEKLITSK